MRSKMPDIVFNRRKPPVVFLDDRGSYDPIVVQVGYRSLLAKYGDDLSPAEITHRMLGKVLDARFKDGTSTRPPLRLVYDIRDQWLLLEQHRKADCAIGEPLGVGGSPYPSKPSGIFEKLLTSRPVNKQAAMVTSIMSVDEPVKQVLTDEKKLEKRAEYLEFYRAGIKNPGWQAWSSEIGTFLSYRGYSGEISPLREVRNAKRHIVRRHQAKLYLGGVGILKFESKKVADAQRIIENAIVARLMKPVRAALPLRELKTR